MGTTFKIEGVVLESVTCCTCGTVFAVAQPMLVKLHQSGGDFYCPSGHILAFAESENDRLRKLAEQATERTREAVAELAEEGLPLDPLAEEVHL